MSFASVKGRLMRRNDAYGIRLDREDVERLGLCPGTEVEVKVDVDPGEKITVDQVPAFNLGGDAADRHDELFAKGALEEHLESIGEGDERLDDH